VGNFHKHIAAGGPSTGHYLYVLGIQETPDGMNNAIFQLAGNGWRQLNGGLGVIAIAPDTGRNWGISPSTGQVWKENVDESGYSLMNGCAVDLSVGYNNDVWALGCGSCPNGNHCVFEGDGVNWHQVGTQGGLAISVDPSQGKPWIIDANHDVYRYDQPNWVKMTGPAVPVCDGGGAFAGAAALQAYNGFAYAVEYSSNGINPVFELTYNLNGTPKCWLLLGSATQQARDLTIDASTGVLWTTHPDSTLWFRGADGDGF
jgi:hypothetical protein